MPDALCPGKEILTHLTGNGWAAYRYIHFDRKVSSVILSAESDGSGIIEIWADDELLGEVPVSATGGEYLPMRGIIRPAQGVHTLYPEWKKEKGAQATLKTIRFE